jgi:hypothetical protein
LEWQSWEKKYNVPTIAFCGSLAEDLGEMSKILLASYSIQRTVLPLEKAMCKEVTLKKYSVFNRKMFSKHGVMGIEVENKT